MPYSTKTSWPDSPFALLTPPPLPVQAQLGCLSSFSGSIQRSWVMSSILSVQREQLPDLITQNSGVLTSRGEQKKKETHLALASESVNITIKIKKEHVHAFRSGHVLKVVSK